LLFTELAEFSEQVRSGVVTGAANWSYVFSGGNILAQLGLALAGSIVGFLVKWVTLPVIAAGCLLYGNVHGAIITISIWHSTYSTASLRFRHGGGCGKLGKMPQLKRT
jgi:hypothetical protein